MFVGREVQVDLIGGGEVQAALIGGGEPQADLTGGRELQKDLTRGGELQEDLTATEYLAALRLRLDSFTFAETEINRNIQQIIPA